MGKRQLPRTIFDASNRNWFPRRFIDHDVRSIRNRTVFADQAERTTFSCCVEFFVVPYRSALWQLEVRSLGTIFFDPGFAAARRLQTPQVFCFSSVAKTRPDLRLLCLRSQSWLAQCNIRWSRHTMEVIGSLDSATARRSNWSQSRWTKCRNNQHTVNAVRSQEALKRFQSCLLQLLVRRKAPLLLAVSRLAQTNEAASAIEVISRNFGEV